MKDKRLSVALIFALSILIFFPSSTTLDAQVVQQNGKEYQYDEQATLGLLETNCETLRAAVKRGGTTPEHAGTTNWQTEPAIVNLGWIIVALGEYSNGSESVSDALFKVKSEFGYLSLPYWLGWEPRRKEIARTNGFANALAIAAS